MNNNCETIKRRFQILIILINIISFIIMIAYINNRKEKYNEYTNLPKLISNSYIIIIFLIMLIHSISKNFICKLFTENINIITNSKGKIVIILLIGILYWTSDNYPHVIFGIINFISFFILILCEFIFDCKIIKDINKNKDINKEEQIITNENNISNNNNMLKNFIKNKHVSKVKKDEKNGSNVPFFENAQNNDNYFENIKKVNLTAKNDIK